MRMCGSTRAFAALLALGSGLGSAASASAAEVRPFEPRFQQRVSGDISIVTKLFAGTGPAVDVFVDGPAGVDWSLVTAWSSPTEPLRDLRVVDGLATTTASDPVAVTVSGLSTPRRRAVDPTVEGVSP